MSTTTVAPHPSPVAPVNPFALSASAHSSLLRAAESLSEAVAGRDPAERYAHAHVAALRAAAALLAARRLPAAPSGRRRPQRNAWVLLSEAAPELADWARFFAGGAAKRAAAEAGSSRAVSAEEAEALIDHADTFLAVVEAALGLVPHGRPDGAGGPEAPGPAATGSGGAAGASPASGVPALRRRAC